MLEIDRYKEATNETPLVARPTLDTVAERARKYSRRRGIMRAALVGVLVALIVPATVAITGSRHTGTNARIGTLPIAHSRIERTRSYDHGALVISPTGRPATVAENVAIGRFRAGSYPMTYVDHVEVALGQVHIADLTGRRNIGAESLNGKPAWVVSWRSGGSYCPRRTDPVPRDPHAPGRFFIFAADGSGRALEYTGAGSVCGQAVTPTASVATIFRSIPWVEQPTPQPPGSGTAQIGYESATCNSVGTPTVLSQVDGPSTRVAVYALVLLRSDPDNANCLVRHTSLSTVVSLPSGSTLVHQPLGDAVGRFTHRQHFTYFDGATRRIDGPTPGHPRAAR